MKNFKKSITLILTAISLLRSQLVTKSKQESTLELTTIQQRCTIAVRFQNRKIIIQIVKAWLQKMIIQIVKV